MAPSDRAYFEIMRSCCTQSTIHGLPNVFKRDQIFVKVFWLMCAFASAVVCSLFVSQSIIGYFNYETVTQAKVVFETPTEFPTVSLCLKNMFTTEAGFAYVQKYLKENDLKHADYYLTHNFFSDMDFIKYGMGVNLMDTNFNDEYRKMMGYQMKDMILVCYFNNFDCFDRDFYWYFDPFYG